jgi:hypothetical protein
MLEAAVTNCIRESVDAELPPRNQSVADSLQRSASVFAAQGTFHSSLALQARAQIGCDELAVCAEIIWRLIQRCHSAFGVPPDEQLAYDLQQQIREHLARQADVVLGLVDSSSTAGFGAQWRTLIRNAVMKRRDELFKRFSNGNIGICRRAALGFWHHPGEDRMDRSSHLESLLALAMLCSVTVSGTSLAADTTLHGQHHGASAGATCPATTDASGAMQHMQAMHEQTAAAKTPAERQAVMAEHMKAMQEGMAMMQRMGSSSSSAAKSSKSMQMRMDMMTMMMQMMMDRQQMMSGSGMDGMMQSPPANATNTLGAPPPGK